MVSERIRTRNKIQKLGMDMLSRRSSFTREDPDEVMFKSWDDFTKIVRDQKLDALLLDRKKIQDTNPSDLVVDYDVSKWVNSYLIPFEEHEKPAHIICRLYTTSYYLNGDNNKVKEFNGYMHCELPTSKEVERELSESRAQLRKENGNWRLKDI